MNSTHTRPRRSSLAFAAVFLLAAANSAPAADGPSSATSAATHFDRQIAPLLARHCLECHGGTEREGGLRLAGRKDALAGGDSGPAIVPGKLDESLAWQYIDAGEMPKDRPPLSEAEKRLFKEWIASGAAWGAEEIDPFLVTTPRRAGYDWWSLQPVKRPPVPALGEIWRDAGSARSGATGNLPDSADDRTHNTGKVAPADKPSVARQRWSRSPIDCFILARLEAAGLHPAEEAGRQTLIRRVTFDLTGLPPSPEDVDDFLADTGQAAWEKLVDRLLASPHHGERWARHWLDVVRFGETQGFERNKIRDNAWRYRDWVIDAFNSDLPYDEFVRRQIAGDVLSPGDVNAMIATGFHVCGTWDQVGHLEGSAGMQKAARQDHLEDLVATLGQAFLGLTINCARCHDHKFDPISQREYYQIAAVLSGVNQADKEREVASLSTDPERQARLKRRIDPLRSELGELESSLREKYASESGPGVEGLQVVYRFDESGRRVVAGDSDLPEEFELKSGENPPLATPAPPMSFINAVKASGEVTIECWLTPGKAQQSGPARIVTLSADSGRRNFTLGHEGRTFDVRLRTTKTDQNGLPSLSTPDKTVNKDRTHVVYTFEKSGTARLYVGGQRVAEQKIGGDLINWDDGFRLALGDELSGERRWEGQWHLVALYDRALDAGEIKQNFKAQSKNVRRGVPFAHVLAAASRDERMRHTEMSGRLRHLESQIAAISYSGPLHAIVPRQPEPLHVLARGDYRQTGEQVEPTGLRALKGLDSDFGLPADAPEAERRRKLAEWLSNQANPLTARVMANRLWHYHFGRGLVEAPSDFGFNGGEPSHPDLLDWLGEELAGSAERGARSAEDAGPDVPRSAFRTPHLWSLKHLHRLLVTSAVYRQVSRIENNAAEGIDADNRLLWRFPRRRLEGEAVRDASLAAAGVLVRTLGGPSYRDVKVDGGVMGTNAEFTDPTGEYSPAVNRRTIYRLWARSGSLPLLESLDCPDPSVMAPQRTRTITPIQALSLLNNVWIEACAADFARRVQREAGSDLERQIDRACRLALSRSPSPDEIDLARPFIEEHGLAQFCLVLFNANEFLYVN